tara:strand:- start:895 stop:3288 length:2394 start_codon:yes stop_codon:yes gene_type:complete
MKIIKSNGRESQFNPSKISKRIKDQSKELKVDSDELSIKIISQMADGMTSRQIDELIVEGAAMKVVQHPDYSKLAARIFVSSLRKRTPDTFSNAVSKIEEDTTQLGSEFLAYVHTNYDILNDIIVQDRDFNHDIFGLKTLERAYLLKGSYDEVIERPQYMWLRVAIEVTGFTLDFTKLTETYDALSEGYYTHATPTLFNSGTKLSQLSSCFLIATKGDDIDNLFDTLKDCARISKLAGGIGLHVHNVRAKGSIIKGTNGKADGLVPMFKTFNETARWINQGGKRKGSFSMYLEPWHADIFDFLEMKKNHGKEEFRARDLFYALWVNDLYMERVEQDGDWTLFCPNEVLKYDGTKLQDLVGQEFTDKYNELVEAGIGRRTVKARELWERILVAQMETGTPYMVYKDKSNVASNQKNLGTIKSSNLCAEIIEYSDENEQAVCNLASIALNKFVDPRVPYGYDFEKLGQVVELAIENLDNVIDANYYPTVETKASNSKHRPVGLGVQGLADVYAMMNLPFDSETASKINTMIFEQMYYSATKRSMELAAEKGAYSTFNGSPASKGILQFDMYKTETEHSKLNLPWDTLKHKVVLNGLRNSLLIALMPTASTSQILGNNECFEPFTSNMYTRRTLAGEYIVINKHLVRDLEEKGLWTPEIINQLKADNGSVQNLPIPGTIKDVYKTAFEISQKVLINQAADRQRFVCQSQSMNLFVGSPTLGSLSSMHLYGWKKELKTGIYYLRSKPAVNAKKVTVEKVINNKIETPHNVESVVLTEEQEYMAMLERAKNSKEDDCDMCGA